jgi:hypothetical protein
MTEKLCCECKCGILDCNAIPLGTEKCRYGAPSIERMDMWLPSTCGKRGRWWEPKDEHS